MTLTPKLTRVTAAATLGLATALTPIAPAVMAQDGQSQSAGEYTDAQLESFVDAAMAVLAVRNEYASQVQQAEDDSTRQELVQQATQEMQAAVEDTDGIDVETYQAIGQASQNDQDLAERINTMVQERQGGDMEGQDGGEG